MILHSLSIYNTIGRQKGPVRYPSPLTLIWGNSDFSPAAEGSAFRAWETGGCHILSDLFNKGAPLTFDQCKARFGLTKAERFCYCQVRHWITQPEVKIGAIRYPTSFENLHRPGGQTRHLTSAIYLILNTDPSPYDKPYIKAWERDVGRRLYPEQWDDI